MAKSKWKMDTVVVVIPRQHHDDDQAIGYGKVGHVTSTDDKFPFVYFMALGKKICYHEDDLMLKTDFDKLSYQKRAEPWAMACFGLPDATDMKERADRFLEEALELYQACNRPKTDALMLLDYVFGRKKGEIEQEVGGVMLTLALLCDSGEISMMGMAEQELDRVWTKIGRIREKHRLAPRNSSLPGNIDTKGDRDEVQLNILQRMNETIERMSISLSREIPQKFILSRADYRELETLTGISEIRAVKVKSISLHTVVDPDSNGVDDESFVETRTGKRFLLGSLVPVDDTRSSFYLNFMLEKCDKPMKFYSDDKYDVCRGAIWGGNSAISVTRKSDNVIATFTINIEHTDISEFKVFLQKAKDAMTPEKQQS